MFSNTKTDDWSLASALICLSPQVILLLAQSEAFEFVLANRADVSVVNAQKLTFGSHVSAVALFPIRPVALGMMEITVDAVSAEASDSLVWRVFVKVCVDGRKVDNINSCFAPRVNRVGPVFKDACACMDCCDNSE